MLSMEQFVVQVVVILVRIFVELREAFLWELVLTVADLLAGPLLVVFQREAYPMEEVRLE